MSQVIFLIGVLTGIFSASLVKVEVQDVYFIGYFFIRVAGLVAALTLICVYFFPDFFKNVLGAHLIKLLLYLSRAIPVLYNRSVLVIKIPGINCGVVDCNGKFLMTQYRAVLVPQMTGKRVLFLKSVPEQHQSVEVGTICPPEILEAACLPSTNSLPTSIDYLIVSPMEGYTIPFKPSNVSMEAVWILDLDNKIVRIVESDQQIWP